MQRFIVLSGLTPQVYGTWKSSQTGQPKQRPTHLSKRGNSHLRKALYFPAVSAITWNPLVKAHYQRLVALGKPKMVALAAAMRKLLKICYGVLKHQQPFDEHWQSVPQTT